MQTVLAAMMADSRPFARNSDGAKSRVTSSLT